MISENLKKKLQTLAEANDEKLEDVLLFFEAIKIKMTELDPFVSEEKLLIRCFNGLNDYYNNTKFNKGSEFIFIPFGVQNEASDSTLAEREKIIADFANPQNRIPMIRGASGIGTDSKVMTMRVKDDVIDNKNVFFDMVYKPVKTIRKMTPMDSGEFVVIDGDLWTPGDLPIARDYNKQTKYEGVDPFENKHWSKPLEPNWKMSLFGIGFFSGMKDVNGEKVQRNPFVDGIVTTVNFYGDYANPTSAKFICKKQPWFKLCKLKAVNTKYSNDLFAQVTSKSDLDVSNIKPKMLDYVEDDKKKKGMITIINERVKLSAEKLKQISSGNLDSLPKEKAEKLKQTMGLYNKFLTTDYIPVIDLNGIANYHITHKALKNEDGSAKKSEGWDEVDYKSFAIVECAYSSTYKKEGKAPKYVISDYSLPENKSIFAKFSNGLEVDLPASTVILSLTTSRGNQAYDEDTKKYIENPEGAVPIPKVRGICILVDFTKLDIKKLIGNLK
jgi:hypothetical protein